MKICQTHYAFYPTTGGVESHLLDLSAELAAQGHEVHALVGSLEDSPPEETLQSIQIHRRDLMNPMMVRERKEEAGFEAEEVWPELQEQVRRFYAHFVRERDIDVIHAHNFHHFLPEYGLALTELRDEGVPTYLTVHEVWSEFICKDLLHRTEWDGIISVSRHTHSELMKQAPDLDNVRLIYHGIDTDTLFTPDNTDLKWADELGLHDRRAIIHPARMLPWKGVIYSVEAMDTIRDRFPDAVLIVTDTEDIVDWVDELKGYKEEVLQRIEDLDLQDHIITQPFPYLELPWVYNQCEVVIYPTIGEEPFGLVPVEAMACGKPTVVSRSGGLPESVVDEQTGYIIPKEDTEALVDRLSRLMENEDLREEMGRAGRKRATEVFTRERMAREVVETYESGVREPVEATAVPAK
ncbi:MAG: glycosyltransferase family 4 protein [Armatimonadota bacterium]|nr:glycosyltransferase family 4 protein [Armatimonadota bacterium]